MLIILCIFLMKLYPKRNMVLNGFNKTRLYGDNKIQGTFTKQKIQCFVVGDGSYFTHETFSFTRATHLWKYKKQIMVHSWNKFLIYQKKKKIKIFYIQKSTVHSVILILDDPLYISNFDPRKVMSFLFLKTSMYLLFAHYIYYVYIPWVEKAATFS